MSSLANMHAITSGLKVLATTVAAQDLEVARRAMGGNGYSAYAGIGREYANHLASVTSVLFIVLITYNIEFHF